MAHTISRSARLVAGAAVAALLLGGCAAETESELGDEPVTLRMVWWGNDVRAQATVEALAAFEEQYPNITVETSSLPYDGYHDTLATQFAANDAPDVFQLQGEFMAQYASQGALLPLTEVDLAALDPGTTENGFRDGDQLAVAAGLSTLTVATNPSVFEQAGIELPDDTTWTWDDYADISRDITANTPDGVFGSKSLGWDVTEVATWVSQRGNQLFTEDGEVGAEAEDFAALFELALRMMEEGGSPSASESAEQLTLAPQESGVATSRYAMQLDAASNFPALDSAYGGGLEMLRMPSQPGDAGDHHMMFVASQYWGASSRTEHPAEAQLLIDFLVNSPEAGDILGVTRGVPNNTETRAAILPDLPEADQAIPNFMSEIESEVVPSYRLTAGTSSFTGNLQRYTSEVLFGNLTPKEAAEALLEETQASVN